MDKVVASATAAVADIPSGARIAAGGFGISGIPAVLIDALVATGVRELEVYSQQLRDRRRGARKVAAERPDPAHRGVVRGGEQGVRPSYLAGELEVELTPQGTLAERLRAAGVGVPAFYTMTGVGTQVAEGGLPWRYAPDGSVAVASPPKPTAEFDGRTYVLERALPGDFAIVRAWKGDRHGNLQFRKAVRNFNPVCAMAAAIAIAEVEHLVEPGDIDPDAVHLPGVYVDRVVALTPEQASDKGIERLTTRARESAKDGE